MPFCPKCGKEISNKAKFCPECGSDIDTYSVKKNEKSIVKETEKDIKIENTKVEERKIEKKYSISQLVTYGIIGVVIIILLVVAISIFAAFSAGFNENIRPSPTLTSAPTIVTTTQIVVTTSPTGVSPTEVTQTTQSTLPTAYISMIGNVYGFATTPAVGIDEISFYIGLAPGTQPIDLTKMKIIFTKSSSSPMILIQGDTASNTVFTTKLNGITPVTSMNTNNQVAIDFKVSNIEPNTKVTIELRPSLSATLPFSKTAPATISKTNILY
jgi:archaellin/RNA polymerase subunit RPABC4/transcription elongation factor Spt4